MTSRIMRAAILCAPLLTMSNAFAAPIMIDFTSALWSGAAGQTVHKQTYGGLEVTLSASGAMSFNAEESNGEALGSLAMLGDGIGIGDDEISFDGGQSIHVAFSSNVTVLGYYFLDFFAGEGSGGLMGELATAALGSTVLFDEGFGAHPLGYYAREGLSITTDLVSFSAGPPVADANLFGFGNEISLFSGLGGEFNFSDFALAGILIDDGSPDRTLQVPEPASVVLLIGGLLGLGGIRRMS